MLETKEGSGPTEKGPRKGKERLKLSHIRLFVPDVRACFLFYRDRMQLDVLHGTEETPFAEFSTGDVHLALEPAAEGTRAAAPTGSDAFGPDERVALIFRVANVDAAHERLSREGVAFVKAPHDTPEWGHRVAYLRDPAGHLIELNQGI